MQYYCYSTRTRRPTTVRVYNGAHYEDPIAHCPPVAQQCHSNKSGPVGSPSRTISPDAFRCVGREGGDCVAMAVYHPQ